MRRYIALLVTILLLFTACGRSDVKPSKTTVTMGRPSYTTTTTTVTTSMTDDRVTSATEETTKTSTDTNETVTTVTTAADETDGTTTRTETTTTEAEVTQTVTTTTTVITTTTNKTTAVSQPSITPPAGNEVRGAWVSYIELAEVFAKCSTPAQAETAIDGMMKRMADCRINTVFFHVRANSDAYYDSAVFRPAASVKKLLDAGFDPLAYAVEAAHKRGITLHAWINPYRIGKDTAYTVKNVPTLTDDVGRYYYVPTSSKAQSLILLGVREILEKYDVDGIQYDDYFYPEGLLEETTVYGFESADYETYCDEGGTLSVGNWRRAGVDALISGTHVLTSAHGVVFGVSPAASADNTYKALYADCRKWLAEEGFVDYICPQIYTGFEHSNSSFDRMVDTWQSYPRHDTVALYVGLALYKIGLKSDTYAGAGKTEWIDHDDVMRRSVICLRDKHVQGICLYSYSYLFPKEKAGLSKTNDVAAAEREIRNLLSLW